MPSNFKWNLHLLSLLLAIYRKILNIRTRSLALPKSGIFDKFRIMHFILDMIACSTKVLCQKNEQKMSFLESIFFFHTDQVMRSYFNLKSEQKMSKILLKLGAKIPSIASRMANNETINSILRAYTENSLGLLLI